MSVEFKEFMEKVGVACCDPDFKDIHQIFYEKDLESFNYSYRHHCKRSGAKVTRQDDILRLRIGFIVDDGRLEEWHTLRFSAFKGMHLKRN